MLIDVVPRLVECRRDAVESVECLLWPVAIECRGCGVKMLFGGVKMVASPRMGFMSSTGLPVECLVLLTEILDALSEVGKAMLIDVVAGVGEVL